MRILSLAAILATLAAPLAAQSRPGLPNEPEITEGLITVGMAYELSERCDGLKARTLTGITTLLGLKNRARGLGYSSAEVDAFIDDDAEKDRLEAIARERLRGLGVVEDQPQSFCAVGRDQIARGTGVGRLLR